jgi:signal transduction histidine kinase
MAETLRQTSSLRQVFGLALVPLSLAVVASFALILVLVENVHDKVECMYIETRQIAQARALSDALHGIETWVAAAPKLEPSARSAADADAQQHLATAKTILRRFLPDESGESADHAMRPGIEDLNHETSEHKLANFIQTELGLMEELLADSRSGLQLADPHVRAASRTALELAAEIEDQARALGASLVLSSEQFVRIVLVIGVAALGLLVGAGFLFRRRILQPIAALRMAVSRIENGDLQPKLALPHADEFGVLAKTMQSMANRIQAHRVDLEERVKQRTTELLRTARLADLGTLAAGVAHEINNPLAAIATCSEGLLRDGKRRGTDKETDPDRARTIDYLEIIAKEAMRARDTTSRLLAFARPESGRKNPVSIQREVADVVTMLDHSAQRVAVRLEKACEDDTPSVLGDSADLRQVVFNLVKNAIDASPEGGVVRIRTGSRDGQVTLEVEDEGTGVTVEPLEKVFEPFVTTKDPGKGTGLGLAISHRIVTDHGGSIRVRNRDGRGARFTVELPALL